MSAVLHQPVSVSQFLEWEERQKLRHEFDGIRAIVMTGGTDAHAAIQSNLARAIGTRLKGTLCRFRGSDLKVEVAGRIRYPDGFVYRSVQPGSATVIRNPVVIFEVTSDSTAASDFGIKNTEYAATPSVQRYLILDQTRIAGTMFERDGTEWVGRLLSRDSIIAMPEIGITVPFAEFYEDLDLGTEVVTLASG